jgi:hypothetical protein
LLDQVKIEVLIGKGGSKVEISIYKCLRSSVKESVDVGLVPASLFDRLKLGIEII